MRSICIKDYLDEFKHLFCCHLYALVNSLAKHTKQMHILKLDEKKRMDTRGNKCF